VQFVTKYPGQAVGLLVGYALAGPDPAFMLALSMAAGVVVGGSVWGFSIGLGQRWDRLGRGSGL
jgi:hypothetical protein